MFTVPGLEVAGYGHEHTILFSSLSFGRLEHTGDRNLLSVPKLLPIIYELIFKFYCDDLIIFSRVALGKMSDFLNTSCLTSLNFLHDTENGYPDSEWQVDHVSYELLLCFPLSMCTLFKGVKC